MRLGGSCSGRWPSGRALRVVHRRDRQPSIYRYNSSFDISNSSSTRYNRALDATIGVTLRPEFRPTTSQPQKYASKRESMTPIGHFPRVPQKDAWARPRQFRQPDGLTAGDVEISGLAASPFIIVKASLRMLSSRKAARESIELIFCRLDVVAR